MPTGDLPGWTLIFNDDFTTPVPAGQFPAAVSTKWGAYGPGWPDTSANGSYEQSNISCADSIMDLYLHTEGGVHMVAAPFALPPGDAGTPPALAYGRYAVCFRADPVPGYKTAWLLWPTSQNWPTDGEIDFPEGDLNTTMNAFLHLQDGVSGGDQDIYNATAVYPDWHVAVTEWAPTYCEFSIDGVVVGRSTARIPNTPMFWVLQTETQLSGGAPADSAAGHVQIDWVAIWSYDVPDVPATYSETVLAEPSLYAYYVMGDAASTPPQDSKGTYHMGGVLGTTAPTWGVTGLLPSDPDTAISFPGSGYFYEDGGASAITLADTLSVEAWISRGATGAQRGISSGGSTGSGAWYVGLDASGNLELWCAGHSQIVASTAAVGTGSHHVVVTKNGADVHLYIDGVEDTGSVTNATLAAPATASFIGAGQWGAYPFNGTIEKLALYNAALTSTQVAAHYAAKG
jgi:hypothetical protein